MSSVVLATIHLKDKDGIAGAVGHAEWAKDVGYVVGIRIPTGQPAETRLIERQVHATPGDALRGLAELVDGWNA